MNNSRLTALINLILVGCLLLPNSQPAMANDKPPMLVKYINYGALDVRLNYKRELMQLILDATIEEYGPYVLESYENEFNQQRQAMLISQGELIDLLVTTPDPLIDSTDAIRIPVDIFRGLLGHRICLMNQKNKASFSSVTDIDSLKKIRIGQGLGWPEVKTYIFNGITPVQASTFEGLLHMLAANRFDCLALDANEVELVYQQKLPQIPTLAIEPDLLIYYALPIYFYVSAKNPQLAARFKSGMEKIQTNGAHKRLFNHYYEHSLDKLNIDARKIICLKSPFLPLEGQCKNLEKVNSLF